MGQCSVMVSREFVEKEADLVYSGRMTMGNKKKNSPTLWEAKCGSVQGTGAHRSRRNGWGITVIVSCIISHSNVSYVYCWALLFFGQFISYSQLKLEIGTFKRGICSQANYSPMLLLYLIAPSCCTGQVWAERAYRINVSKIQSILTI